MQNLRSVADDYFRSLNPIAKRICDDVKSTRENYESAWNYLSPEERNQVINESLIYPAAALRYSLREKEHDVSSSVFPDFKDSVGRKILEDESGVQWTDEHSSPFSWKTSSQLDLSAESNINYVAKETKQIDKKNIQPPLTPKSNNGQTETSDNSVETIQNFPDYPNQLEDEVDSKVYSNSAIDEDPSSSNEICETSNSQHIPKTGCEFLDNW